MTSAATTRPGCRRSSVPETKRSLRQRLLPGAVACLLTLLAGPLGAVDIPPVPLQSGAAYLPPNLMFILDDSGSMNLVAMPAALSDPNYRNGTGAARNLDDDRIGDASYVHNTIYYNPSIDYRPWVDHDGDRYPASSYRAAWRHTTLLADEIDLGRTVQTFYVPKAAGTTSTDERDYYRYQIRSVNGNLRVVRSEWLRVNNGNQGAANAGCASWNGNDWRNCTFNTATGRSEAAEMANYANWYSYHRSRMKVAKAGASEAFAQLLENMRLGLDTINRNTTGLPYRIPVGSNGGLFGGTNRREWFERLHAARADGNTPLHRALQRAGDYYSDSSAGGPSAGGPYGPLIGEELVSCRQNFTILTTDGYWNNFSGYTSVGDADGTAGPTVSADTDGDGTLDKSYSYTPERPYIDNFAGNPNSRGDTLADVAMHYWKRDLVDALENNVPSTTDDPAFWQHMVTFGVSIGLRGRLDPDPEADDLTSITNGSKRWGDPMDREDLDRIDDLWHASVNGRGSFLTAQNSNEFAQALADALQTIAARPGSASNVSTNSTSFVGNTRVFQAKYVSGQWTGELSAYAASRQGVAETPDWTAAGQIQRAGRTVLTWNGTRGVDFPTSAQEAALERDTGLAPVTGEDNADYLMGETILERRRSGRLRNRESLLGDIVNSSPYYLKVNETIFVGANDGMLHAFNALDGSERFAYVPGGIDLAALSSLSDPQYVSAHRYFVDGPIIVSTQRQTPGRNILVGALGRGGKGLFALDVTSAASMRRQDVLWERSGGANMGQVLGEPLIATLNDANRTTALIVGNGINSDSGHATLLVLNLLTGAVIREIDTGVGGDNGLFAPRGRDIDGNGTVDYIYAGDLTGRLWKFDLSGAATASWDVAYSGRPMFQAPDGQPITGGLAIGNDPNDGSRWVFFGTGRFLSDGDVSDMTVQSLYGLIDDGSGPVGRDDLQERSIVVTTTSSGHTVRAFEPESELEDGHDGWYIDFDQPTPVGERIVTRPQLRGNALVVASIIPPDGSVCDVGGRGFINALDAFSGASLNSPFFDVNDDGTFDGDDQVTSGGEQLPVGSIDLGVGMPTLPTTIDELLVVGGSDGEVGDVLTNPPGGKPRRIRWREIILD